MPLPLPSLPSNAGSAIARGSPLPPLRPRSSPLPGANTSGSASASQLGEGDICSPAARMPAAARATGHSRAIAMNSSSPSTCCGDERVIECSDALQLGRQRQASSTSVPGTGARCRSACSAILVRSGSTTTSSAVALRLCGCWRTRCRLATVALLPHTTFSLAPAANPGGHAWHRAIGAGPGFAAHAAAHARGDRAGCAKPVEEAQRHAVAGQHAVRAGIVQRHDRLRSPALDHLADARRGSRPAPASQEMRSNCPEPFGPVRRSGCSSRCGPCTKAPPCRAPPCCR